MQNIQHLSTNRNLWQHFVFTQIYGSNNLSQSVPFIAIDFYLKEHICIANTGWRREQTQQILFILNINFSRIKKKGYILYKHTYINYIGTA